MTTIDQQLIDQFTGKRFLFVLGQFGRLGGAERQALILADHLKRLVGANVEFLAWGGSGMVDSRLADLGIKAHVFPLNWASGRFQQILTLRRLAKFIRQQCQPDYLMPYIGFNCKIIGLIWKHCGAKFTWWNQRDEGREVYGSRTEHKVLASVPGIVSNSFEGRDFLVQKFGLREQDITVINNGIILPEVESGDACRRQLGLNADELLITMVANHTEYKDHRTLVRAFSELRKTDVGKRCHLCLAGRHDNMTTELKVMGFDLGLSGCLHLPGIVEDVSQLWAATDLAVHSSVTEGCPNAALEAMSHGLAVCGTDISGMRQAIGQSSSEVLAAPANVQQLAQILEFLLSDAAVLKEHGEKNRRRVIEFFSPQKLTSETLSYISARI